MSTVTDLLDRRRPHQTTVRMSTRNDLAAEIDQTRAMVALAEQEDERENRLPQAPALKARLTALTAERLEDAVAFTFQELGRARYERLLREHPPRPIDIEADADWNTDTFPAALIAAACVDPAMTGEEAQRLWDELPFGEARALFVAAIGVQAKVGAVPLPSPGTGETADTGTNSTTAPPAGYPTPSF